MPETRPEVRGEGAGVDKAGQTTGRPRGERRSQRSRAGWSEWEEVKEDQEGANAAKKTGEARGGALEKPDQLPPRRVSEGPVSHQNAAFSPRHHRALLAGLSHTRAACTRLSSGS